MKGGEEFKAYTNYPVAPSNTSINVVVVAPSFKAWGVFLDGYPGSPVQKVDMDMNEIATCSDGSVWASVEVEVKVE